MVGLHTVVRYYLPDGKELLQGGATVIAKLSNWIELEDDYEKIKSSSMVLDFVSYANAFVSGLFYKEAEGTPLNSAFIPKIPADDLVKGMKIELVKQLNCLTLAEFSKKQDVVKDLFGDVGVSPFVGDIFHCDFGKNIHVGDNFHADYNCTMLDVAEIRIGHNCLIGPDVGIYTAGHRLEPEGRTLDGYGMPIVIGDDVWIGGHSTILPGVMIGDGAVIAAGSVVTENVEPRTLVAGNPAKKKKLIK